ENAGAICLARASRGENGSRRVWIDSFANRKSVTLRSKRIVRVSIRLRFQHSERAARTEGSLNSMQGLRERLFTLLFPADTDNWLAVLRVGTAFQVVFFFF